MELVTEETSAIELLRILGEGMRCAFATRRELGENMKHELKVLHMAASELKIDEG